MPHPPRRDPEASAAELQAGSLGTLLAELPQRASDDAAGQAEVGWDTLLTALTHPNPAQRILAFEASCQLSERHAQEIVIGMLADIDPAVRRAAASATERLATPRLVSALIVTLDDPDMSVRSACRRSLEAITKRPIASVEGGDVASRSRAVKELQAWWKRERLTTLIAAAGAKVGS